MTNVNELCTLNNYNEKNGIFTVNCIVINRRRLWMGLFSGTKVLKKNKNFLKKYYYEFK